MASLVQVHSTGNAGLNGGVSGQDGEGSLLSLLVRPGQIARMWWTRHEARRQLLEMDDHMLRDIGLTRGQAVREWQKGFWEA